MRITVEEGTATISLVGEGISSEAEILKRGLTALLASSAVRMVSQGGAQKSISFAVPEPQLTQSVENLHREFFRAADPAIFAPTPESSRTLSIVRAAEKRTLPGRADWGVRSGVIRAR